MQSFFLTFAEELLSKFDRVSSLIKHGATIGTYREKLTRNFLSNFLSSRYRITTGFIYSPASSESSRQIDVLIIDENVPTPFLFKDDDFVIVKKEAVVLGIEIKSSLKKPSFKEAVENCFSFKKICPGRQYFIFAFESTPNLYKVASGWYQKIPKSNLSNYPNSIFALNAGWFQMVPSKFANPWGHYFIVPHNVENIAPLILTNFLATIAKTIDSSSGLRSNPYADYNTGEIYVHDGCFRFAEGKIDGKIRVP